MGTHISLFDYELPPEQIAQKPMEPRDHSRLMVMDRATGQLRHTQFFEIADELKAGDVLVFNVTKVFRARLKNGAFEVFVLAVRDGEIDALVRPGKKFVLGKKCPIGQFVPTAKTADGIVTLSTGLTADEMLAFCEAHGEVPTPPYVSEAIEPDRYQTVYAKATGSVAAPTAGLHFTPELLEKLRAKGVQTEEVILHVGVGTFRPVQVETLEAHVMHREWVHMPGNVADRLATAKAEGRRVIAVGTTTVRVLEGVAALRGRLEAYQGEIGIFIVPGYRFHVIDALITNFHLPKSTLLVLVSAFAGREHVLAAYEEAKREGYRFFSFGDAMFIA